MLTWGITFVWRGMWGMCECYSGVLWKSELYVCSSPSGWEMCEGVWRTAMGLERRWLQAVTTALAICLLSKYANTNMVFITNVSIIHVSLLSFGCFLQLQSPVIFLKVTLSSKTQFLQTVSFIHKRLSARKPSKLYKKTITVKKISWVYLSVSHLLLQIQMFTFITSRTRVSHLKAVGICCRLAAYMEFEQHDDESGTAPIALHWRKWRGGYSTDMPGWQRIGAKIQLK